MYLIPYNFVSPLFHIDMYVKVIFEEINALLYNSAVVFELLFTFNLV